MPDCMGKKVGEIQRDTIYKAVVSVNSEEKKKQSDLSKQHDSHYTV